MGRWFETGFDYCQEGEPQKKKSFPEKATKARGGGGTLAVDARQMGSAPAPEHNFAGRENFVD